MIQPPQLAQLANQPKNEKHAKPIGLKLGMQSLNERTYHMYNHVHDL